MVNQTQIHDYVVPEVIQKTIRKDLLNTKTKYHINPTGRFVIGGPHGDTGLTGRKIIVNTYGGAAPHGGGAFSGKDPTKVDRSGAYAARYVAKNVVAAGLADRCQIQVAYAIGVARPVSVAVETFGTEKIGPATIARHIDEHRNDRVARARGLHDELCAPPAPHRPGTRPHRRTLGMRHAARPAARLHGVEDVVVHRVVVPVEGGRPRPTAPHAA